MELTHQSCYQAVQAHDFRFDGLFFTCVSSTHIYCRPICRAQIPKSENCSFVRTAALAEKAGFRPCLRCRPELAPDTRREARLPAQQLAAYIDDTLLLDETLGMVVRQYRISERHLRRLFIHEFGVNPKEYLTTRRLLFAKQLLQDTNMPILQVVYSAGFSSPGRLTISMHRAYGLTPMQLRKQQKKLPSARLQLRADYRPPFDWSGLLQFLERRLMPGEQIEDEIYYREIDGRTIMVNNNTEQHRLTITLPAELSRQAYNILRKVRHLFDLDANPLVIEQALSADTFFTPLVKKYPGLRLPGCWNSFEMLLRTIVGQQISVAGATTLLRRLANAIGLNPKQIAHRSPAAISALGIPLKRATTICRVAVMVQNGLLPLNERDPQRFYNHLVAIPGLGAWSAEYLQMRVLHWPDALPASDLGLQKILISGQRQTEKQLRAESENWRPWRSYATMLLWRSLEKEVI